MSSRPEVLIRILALLQRKTLIETKNRTLKWHYWIVRSIKKCCTVDGGRGIWPLFSSPPRGICQLKSPHPRKFAIQGKKTLIPGGQPGGGGAWAQVELTDALDWIVKINFDRIWANRSQFSIGRPGLFLRE